MNYLRRFVLMLQFMTTIPVKTEVNAGREDFGRALSAAPAVGLVIGLLLAGFHYLVSYLFSSGVCSVLTVGLYIFLTGGLHLDGLGDTADGLFSNRSRERILEIMKDSRVGTNAVIAVALVLLLNAALISSIENHINAVLLLMPVTGRIGSLIGAGASGYAGISDGPGRWSVEYCGIKEVITGLVVYLCIFASVSAIYSQTSMKASAVILAAGMLPPLTAFLLARLLGRKLGGVTGDILGAVCELNQVIFLLTSSIIVRML